jgi:endonuclease YncB( thermonuclease family)
MTRPTRAPAHKSRFSLVATLAFVVLGSLSLLSCQGCPEKDTKEKEKTRSKSAPSRPETPAPDRIETPKRSRDRRSSRRRGHRCKYTVKNHSLARVYHIVDADTIYVQLADPPQKIIKARLAGINAPECKKKKVRLPNGRYSARCVKDDEHYGLRAYEILKKMIKNKTLRISCQTAGPGLDSENNAPAARTSPASKTTGTGAPQSAAPQSGARQSGARQSGAPQSGAPHPKRGEICKCGYYGRPLLSFYLNPKKTEQAQDPLRPDPQNDIGVRLLRAGGGMAYTKYPHPHLARYCRAELQARRARRGLWALGPPKKVLSKMSRKTRRWYRKHDKICQKHLSAKR